MTDKGFNDEALILKVKNWQTADKYAVCFSRGHGKISFLAYGARYARTNGGRLVQPFAVLDMNFFAGKKLDTVKSCELISYPLQFDLKQMAYAALRKNISLRKKYTSCFWLGAACLQSITRGWWRFLT